MSIPEKQTQVQLAGFDVANFQDKLQVVTDAPVAKPGAGEVLIKVLLRPINPADVFSIQGIYPAYRPKSFPAVPGMEGMGVIAAVGEGVTGLKVGQRVTSIQWPTFGTGSGWYQEYLTGPADAVAVVPDNVTDDQAACAAVNPVTIIGMMKIVGDVPKDEYLLTTAAGSAVSQMLLGLCKDRGIKIIGTVRRKEAVKEALDQGFAAVINTADEDLVQRARDITGGKGVFAAFDCMSGDMTSKLCQALRNFGILIPYGAMLGPEFKLSVMDTLFKAMRIQAYWCHMEVSHMTPEQRKQRMEEVWDLYRRKIITSGAGQTLPLAQALDALKQHHQQGRGGKIMLGSSA